MTTVSILPIPAERGTTTYVAVSGGRQSAGKTVGEALDALNVQLNDDQTGTMVIVQHYRPDQFFDRVQQRRLEELMTRWRMARDAGQAFPAEEQAELEAMVDTELRAAADRCAATANAMGR